MSANKTITLLIADDQEIIRLGIKYALEAFPDLKVVAESADGVTAILDALATNPRVVLMDVGLPKIDGIQASRQIKQALPDVKIIMFTTADDDETIFAALGAGADGYCLKNVSPEHLYSAIKAVAGGVAWLDPGIADRVLRSHRVEVVAAPQPSTLPVKEALTADQMHLLRLLSNGADLEDMASQFDLSPDGIAELLNGTIARLKASSNSEANPVAVSSSNTSDNESDNSTQSLPIELPEQKILGDRYAIESVLGQGGMGIVYKGRHLLIDRPVAIKMLRPEFVSDEQVVSRFLREAKSLSSLSHPNLVAVFDYGMTTTKEPYLVMEYYEGRGLDDILVSDAKIGVAEIIPILCQVCDALTAVHSKSIVHRDVKPSNVLISGEAMVKLVDFGIAKSLENKSMTLTEVGEVVGTPKYMSPEQCLGKDLDSRSDIYSLGCVMYEAITGRAPFYADSFYELVQQHLETVPSNFSVVQSSPAVSQAMAQGLVDVIFQALAKDPSQRQQTAAKLKDDLLAVAAMN